MTSLVACSGYVQRFRPILYMFPGSADQSSHMTWKADEPYNSLPELPPTTESRPPRCCERRSRLVPSCGRVGPGGTADAEPRGVDQYHPATGGTGEFGDREHRHHDRRAVPAIAQSESESASPETKETLRYLIRALRGTDQCQSTAAVRLDRGRGVHHHPGCGRCDVRRLPARSSGNPVTRRAIYTPPGG